MSSVKNLIEEPHWVYKMYHAYWSFLLDSYEGGIDYTKGDVAQPGVGSGLKNWAFKIFAGSRELQQSYAGNLFMHPKERGVDYRERLKMSYYYNFCSPIIDIYSDHLFKQPIQAKFEDIEKDVELRKDNIDNKDGSITEFRKEMADLSQMYGHIYVITDSPQFAGDVNTKADIYNNNLLPYFTFHHPQNIINWALD